MPSLPSCFSRRALLLGFVRTGVVALTLFLSWPVFSPHSMTAQAQDAGSIELADGITDRVLGEYRDLALNWDSRLDVIASALFFALLTLQGLLLFGRAAIDVLGYKPVPGLEDKTLRFLLFSLFASAILFTSEIWIQATYNTFMWGASVATQQDEMASPGTIAMQGWSLASVLEEEESSSSSLRGSSTALSYLVRFSPSQNITGLTSLVIILCFLGIAVQIFITQVAFFMTLGVAPFFLSFGGLQYTAGFVDGYLRWLAYISAKMFILYMLIGVASDLPMNLAELYNEPTPDGDAWGWIGDIPIVNYAEDYYEYVSYRTRVAVSILVAVVSTAFTVIALPRRMADFLTRGVEFGVSDMLDF